MPRTLKYRTKAKIRADNGFKKTSSEFVKKGEQETLKAIIRFHYREIDHFKVKVKTEKRSCHLGDGTSHADWLFTVMIVT